MMVVLKLYFGYFKKNIFSIQQKVKYFDFFLIKKF